MERSPYFRIRSGLRQKIIKFLNHYSEKKNIEYFIEDKNAFAQYVTTFLVAFSGNKVVSLHLVGDDTMAFGDMLFTQDFLSCNIAWGERCLERNGT